MTIVRYTGAQASYELTVNYWAEHGIIGPDLVWNQANGWAVTADALPTAVTNFLQAHGAFVFVNAQIGVDELDVVDYADSDNWPPEWGIATVFGKYIQLDGSAEFGQVHFDMAPIAVNTADATVFPKTLSVDIDINDGTWSIDLPHPSDPDINPTGWTYTVTEDFENGRDPFSITVVGGTTTNINDLAPVPSSPGNAVVKGDPGDPNLFIGIIMAGS